MAQPSPLSFTPSPRKPPGRGAHSNQSGRFEAEQREAYHDGWIDNEPPPQKTHLQRETPRKIITYNDSPFVGFDRSINPYRGCEHGCIYCFARPTHAYMGLSPGLDFETRLFVKPDAPELLRRELSAKSYRVKPIAIGTNTDPYQPAERTTELMREILQVLLDFRHPVSILTKSDLILRDLDLLQELQQHNLVRAMLSVTTLDRKLARSMEPRAPTPSKRLAAIKALSEAGIPTGSVHGPMIPGLNDQELESLLSAAREAGAAFTAYTLMRLPREVGPLFIEWLDHIAPDRKSKVLSKIKDINGGRLYDVERSRGAGPKGAYADLIAQRFRTAKRRLGFGPMPKPSSDLFRPPPVEEAQRELFE